MLTLEQMWSLARVWYRGRMDSGWRGRPIAESRKILADVGFEDGFWALPS